MTILLSGGGTGGHITPILAVAHELKRLQPGTTIVYVGERKGAFTHLTKDNPDIDVVYEIYSGKFRRYHGESWLRRVFDVKTNLQNLRDAVFVLLGWWQSRRILRRVKPNAILLKGGYVGVPIGLAAKRRYPIITHDSDAMPGLANRLVSKWAVVHATAMPAKYYQYPKDKVKTIGVLVQHDYQPVTSEMKADYRRELKLPQEATILLITGGSSGAERINQAVAAGIPDLLNKYPELDVIHQAGKGKTGVYQGWEHPRLQIVEFLSPMYQFMGAADVVVSRASGNTMAELGVQGKAVIAVPSPFLAGGHQLKNADYLEEQGAALVIREEKLYDPQQGLMLAIEYLLGNKDIRRDFAETLQRITAPDATEKLAQILIDHATRK